MRVLVTGAAGSIGRVVCPGLRAQGHEVVGVDLADPPTDLAGADAPAAWHVADCADPEAVDAVVARVRPDAVVHLAGIPTESSLPDALVSHVHTTAALLEAMVRHGLPRLVYASSNHAVGRTPRSPVVGVGTRPRPDTFYGTAKVAAEALMSLYADRHGIDAVACRIGSFLPRPTSRRALATWLSPGDCVRMVQAALTCPSPGFAVLYGISANTRAWWDLGPGRALGYLPQDDAEGFAAELEATPESDDDRAEAEHVGGPYATDRFARPAF
ncbi:MAG TPA: NAD(P)-dependent oxidoreductase [Marmoricola sp.]|nr:NAD(P)-dependent oxidoreductase [Marmoricola sp.]